MDSELALELDRQLEQGALAARVLADQAADLPEMGLFLARGRPERRGVDGPDPLSENAEAGPAEDGAAVVLDSLEVLRALDEDVGDGEARVERQRRVVAA